MDDVVTSTAPGVSTEFSALFDSAVSESSTAETATEDTSTTEQVDTSAETDTSAEETGNEEIVSAEADDSAGEESAPVTEETVQPEEPKTAEGEPDIKLKVKNGKEYFDVPRSRWEGSIYPGYKAAQEAESVIGEPLTREAIETRQNAYVDQQSIVADFLSGDASAEANVLSYFAQIADAARKNGEVAHDPLANLAARIPDFFAKNQQAYSALATPVLKNELAHLKQVARDRVKANKDDDGLALSIEHIERALFNQYEPREKFLQTPDPVDARLREIEERERRLNEIETNSRKQQWTEFSKQTNTEIRDTVTSAVDAALKDVAAAYEQFPEDFSAVKRMLREEFNERTKKDAAWQANIQSLVRKAQNSATPSAREAVKKDLLARFKAKAEYLLDPVRNESVRGILQKRAASMKAASDAKHKRLATAAAQREPGAPGTAVPQNAKQIKPNGSGTKAFTDFFDAALA